MTHGTPIFLLLTLSAHCIPTHTAYEPLAGEPSHEEHKQPLLPPDDNHAHNQEQNLEHNQENAHQEVLIAPAPEPTLPLCDYCNWRVPFVIVMAFATGGTFGIVIGVLTHCPKM